MHRRGTEWYYPFKVYLPVLFLGRGLWSPRSWRAVARARGPGWFLFLWVAVPLAVFSLAGSRLPTYVLPLYPAIAIVLAVKAFPLYLPPPARDMTALWRLVREDDEAGRALVFYEVERGWGLDFHASKPAIRTFRSGPRGPDTLGIDALLDDLVSRREGSPPFHPRPRNTGSSRGSGSAPGSASRWCSRSGSWV